MYVKNTGLNPIVEHFIGLLICSIFSFVPTVYFLLLDFFLFCVLFFIFYFLNFYILKSFFFINSILFQYTHDIKGS